MEAPPQSPERLHVRAEKISDGRCHPLSTEDAVRAILEGSETIWMHVVARDTAAATRLLRGEMHFHELAVEDSLSDTERPTLQLYGETVFLSVPMCTLEGLTIRVTEIGVFLVGNSIVTVTTSDSALVDNWYARWRDNPRRVGESAAQVLYILMDAAVDSYFPLVDDLEDRMDELTEAVFQGDSDRLPEIMRIKRSFLDIRRALTPLRDMMNTLLRRDLALIPDSAKPYFQDVYDHILRVAELLEANRETLTGLLDIHLSTVSYSLNNVMKKMTVLSTVLMTMALVSGVYGMNFHAMPELEWQYGYPYAIGLMFVLAGMVLLIFRRIKWL